MLPAPMYRIGDFVLDVRNQLLLKDGLRIDLARKPYAIFAYLVENRDRLVTRRELLDRFWDGKEVYDQTLTRAVARIRGALGENRGESHYIETRWATGYQYIGPLMEVPDSQPAPEELVDVQDSNSVALAGAETQVPALPQPAVEDHRFWSKSRALAAAICVVVISAGVVWMVRGSHLRDSRLTGNAPGYKAAPRARKAVAVLPFENLSGNSKEDWLGTALPEMINSDLLEDGRLRTIPGAEVHRAVTELRLQNSADLSRENLDAVNRDLFSDLTVTGSFTVLDSDANSVKRVRMDLKVTDTRSGDVVASCSESGRFDELFEIATSASSRLLASLVPAASPGEPLKLEASAPTNPEAMREYMEGLKDVRAENLEAATAHLERSEKLEPSFAMAHFSLADVWGMRGYQEKQRAEAKLAESLSDGLSREEKLSVNGRYASTIGDWPKAIDAYRALNTFFPDNIEYGLALANVQTQGGKPQDAETTLKSLRESPEVFHDDPRIDLAAAYAAQSMSESRLAADEAQRAVNKARESGALLLYAHALSVHAGNMAGIDIRKSISETEEARRICEQLNDLNCVANNLRRIGIFEVNSDPAAAEANLQEALRLAQRIGNLGEKDNDLNGLAAILSNRGDYKSADAMYRQLLRDGHELNSGWGIQMALNNLGNDLFMEGDVAQAQQMQEEALRISRQIGLKAAAGDELLSLSQINLARGNLPQAKSNAEEALSVFSELHASEERAIALFSRGDAERVEGNLLKAQKDQREAVDVLTGLGDVAILAESRLDLARSILDSGDSDSGTALSQSAVTDFARERRPGEEASAHATLALALAQSGKQNRAWQEMHRALSLIGESQNEILRDEVQIDAALLLARSSEVASSGEVEQTNQTISQILERAEKLHLELIAMDARLAQAELKLRNSSIRENQSRLEAIVTEAQKTGYRQLARRAQHLLGLLAPETSGLAIRAAANK